MSACASQFQAFISVLAPLREQQGSMFFILTSESFLPIVVHLVQLQLRCQDPSLASLSGIAELECTALLKQSAWVSTLSSCHLP